jgi:hypothetical protein
VGLSLRKAARPWPLKLPLLGEPKQQAALTRSKSLAQLFEDDDGAASAVRRLIVEA